MLLKSVYSKNICFSEKNVFEALQMSLNNKQSFKLHFSALKIFRLTFERYNYWRHDSQHNDTQHKELIFDTSINDSKHKRHPA